MEYKVYCNVGVDMNSKLKTFGIIGGDKRQLFLAQSLLSDGYNVIMGGFDALESSGLRNCADLKTAALYCDAVILPLPSVRADKSLNAPFSNQKIFFSNELVQILASKPVFAAMTDRLLRAYPALDGAEVFDYASRDDFAILNAVPTAEGAVQCAMERFEGTIDGSKSLVTGFGRIGKILARMLKNLGSDVTVCARKPSDLAYISALGYRAKNTSSLTLVHGYDLVFNTVPALIFNADLLKNTDQTTLLIDLASLPGGVDFESAHALGIDAQRALALPGKCAPKTAGEIIKKTVFSIIEEVGR